MARIKAFGLERLNNALYHVIEIVLQRYVESIHRLAPLLARGWREVYFFPELPNRYLMSAAMIKITMIQMAIPICGSPQ
ncbi:MAG: hypothetical protein AAB134_02410 [Pseudomonadota bacterium]